MAAILSDKRIKRAIAENQTHLLIIDPVQAFLGDDVYMSRANKVRPVSRKLGDIAHRHARTNTLICPLNKAVGTQSTYLDLGSIDMTVAVRSSLFIGKHERQARCIAKKSLSRLDFRSFISEAHRCYIGERIGFSMHRAQYVLSCVPPPDLNVPTPLINPTVPIDIRSS